MTVPSAAPPANEPHANDPHANDPRANEQAAAAAGEDLIALALQAGGIGTLDVDLRAMVAHRGGAGARVFGVADRQRLSHQEWLALLHPDDRDAVTAAFETTLRTGAAYDVEYRVHRKTDGEERWVAVRAAALLDADGVPYRLVGVVQDVTRQKQAERALLDSEARLKLAQRAAGIGSFDWSFDRSQPAAVSEEYVTIHGLPGGTTHDSYAAWLARVHLDDRARVAAELDAMAGGGTHAAEYRIVRHDDGAVRWLSSRVEVLADRGRTGVRAIGAVRDVTERRAIETQLRALNENLERRVREEVAAREAAQLKLAQTQRLEALGQLAGGIAHDFNNVLQSMQGAAALIERRADDPGSVRRLARMSLEAAARGASITRRLLAFSRRDDLRAEAVDLASLLGGLREMLVHALGAEIGIRIELAPGLPPPHADKGQLETVLVNLATNARDAMQGGGTLTFSAAHVGVGERPDATGLPPGAYVRIVVRDTGTGMDAATLARASEPFFTTKPLDKGTGLGLAMARGFAEQSGGMLQIESVEREGTSVALWLPVAPELHARLAVDELAPVPGCDLPARAVAPATEPRRILLIDDEDAVRETIALQLEADGYAVTRLRDGALALALIVNGEIPDLVVCDLSMPGVNGIEVIRGIHRLLPELPVILLTGYAGDEAALAGIGQMSGVQTGLSRADSGGRLDLLRKPVAGHVLAERIAVLLGSRVAAASSGAGLS